MIRVLKKDDHIEVSGHAAFAEYGKDIVCSACSSIVTTTVNGILSIDKDSLDYSINEEGMEITIKKSDEITSKLIDNMVNLLRELESNYPDNIEVK